MASQKRRTERGRATVEGGGGGRSNVTASRNAAISHPYLICRDPPRAFSAPPLPPPSPPLPPPPPPTRPFAFSVVQRVSAESPQTSVFQAPEDRSLTRYPYPLSPASLYSLPKGIERAENLNSLLGLLIPRIDAEFRAQPFALIPSSPFPSIRDLHLRSSARLFESSFVRRPAARRDPHGRGRAGKSAVSIGTVRLVTRDSVGITTIDRASERASGNAATAAATSKLCVSASRPPAELPYPPFRF